ncbi:hypothetical protein A1O1_07374 [Capronia coronata CBS 617.96]|uniref:Large ribosomal subunit protein eL39 n=1 Tax=Capronia coronata CBS 617.96 TaxID=1182541 RepID=W9XU35_9EURO|nr:uncharacterized protein A1O1_07374 [Capronia coronata CBS 617.96]EXJ83748.1 hypothetical protein A1O1_07374 [Capronia coronata CBS 617.96]
MIIEPRAPAPSLKRLTAADWQSKRRSPFLGTEAASRAGLQREPIIPVYKRRAQGGIALIRNERPTAVSRDLGVRQAHTQNLRDPPGRREILLFDETNNSTSLSSTKNLAITSDKFVKMPSHKSFRTKQKLAKAQKQNRPIPQWIRLRTGNTIRLEDIPDPVSLIHDSSSKGRQTRRFPPVFILLDGRLRILVWVD